MQVSVQLHGLLLEFDVEYEYTPAERGDLYCPPSDAELELTSVMFCGEDVGADIDDVITELIVEEVERKRKDW